jgi:type I restriction enzyme R subunit
MSKIGKPERATQNRVIALFRDELDYDYLGDWEEREGNSNIEEALLSQWLAKQGTQKGSNAKYKDSYTRNAPLNWSFRNSCDHIQALLLLFFCS